MANDNDILPVFLDQEENLLSGGFNVCSTCRVCRVVTIKAWISLNKYRAAYTFQMGFEPIVSSGQMPGTRHNGHGRLYVVRLNHRFSAKVPLG